MIGPALDGLLRSLPPWNKPFEPGHKERFLKALDAVLDLEYPPQKPTAWNQGPCDECGTTWKANEVLPCPECSQPTSEAKHE